MFFNNRLQSGSVGILAVIVLALLGVLSAGLVLRTTTEMSMAANYRNGVAAQALAESGARWGKTLFYDTTTRHTIITDTDVSPKTYVNMGQGTGFVFGNGSTAGTIKVTIGRDPKDPSNPVKREIRSVAQVGSAHRQIILSISLSGLGAPANAAEYALYAGTSIWLLGDAIYVHVGPIGSGGVINGSPQNYHGETYNYTTASFPMPVHLVPLPSGNITNSSIVEGGKSYYFDGDVTISGDAFPHEGALIYVTGNITVQDAHVNNGVLYAGEAGGKIFIHGEVNISGALIANDSIIIDESANVQIQYDQNTAKNLCLLSTPFDTWNNQ